MKCQVNSLNFGYIAQKGIPFPFVNYVTECNDPLSRVRLSENFSTDDDDDNFADVIDVRRLKTHRGFIGHQCAGLNVH